MPSPFPGMNPYVEHPSVWQSLARTRGLVFRGEKEVVLILRARSDEVTVRTLDKAIDTFLEYLPPTPKIIVILHLAD